MSESLPVRLSAGLPETVLSPEPSGVVAALELAQGQPGDRRRDAVADVVRSHPTSLAAWAALGSYARDDVEAYACFRVGYHRGLDALRAAGWKGSGSVRWIHPDNRPFLRCLEGLSSAAGSMGEQAEEERCTIFLRQLDSSWRPGRDGSPV